jgi:hypothetical protein
MVISYRKNKFDINVTLSAKKSDLVMLIFDIQQMQRHLDKKIKSAKEHIPSGEKLRKIEIIEKKISFITLKDESQLRSSEDRDMLMFDKKINSAKIIKHLVQELVDELDRLMITN